MAEAPRPLELFICARMTRVGQWEQSGTGGAERMRVRAAD